MACTKSRYLPACCTMTQWCKLAYHGYSYTEDCSFACITPHTNLQSRLGNGNIRNSWASCWLPDSYPSLVSWLLCTRVREWGYLVYTHAGCLAENLQESVLCPTLIMIYVTFQALVKMCWSYRRMLLNLKHKTMYCARQTELPFACVTLLSNKLSLYYKTCIEPW